jgi:hypothetical protein
VVVVVALKQKPDTALRGGGGSQTETRHCTWRMWWLSNRNQTLHLEDVVALKQKPDTALRGGGSETNQTLYLEEEVALKRKPDIALSGGGGSETETRQSTLRRRWHLEEVTRKPKPDTVAEGTEVTNRNQAF